MSDKPMYQDEVCNEGRVHWEDRQRVAQEKGYKWFATSNGKVFKVVEGGGWPENTYLAYRDLPIRDLNEKFMQWLASPNRTESHKILAWMVDVDFLNQNYKEQVKLIEAFIAKSNFCESGIQRFRDAMGDSLPKPKKFEWKAKLQTVNAHLTAIDNGADGRWYNPDTSSYNIRNVRDKLSNIPGRVKIEIWYQEEV